MFFLLYQVCVVLPELRGAIAYYSTILKHLSWIYTLLMEQCREVTQKRAFVTFSQFKNIFSGGMSISHIFRKIKNFSSIYIHIQHIFQKAAFFFFSDSCQRPYQCAFCGVLCGFGILYMK